MEDKRYNNNERRDIKIFFIENDNLKRNPKGINLFIALYNNYLVQKSFVLQYFI